MMGVVGGFTTCDETISTKQEITIIDINNDVVTCLIVLIDLYMIYNIYISDVIDSVSLQQYPSTTISQFPDISIYGWYWSVDELMVV